MAFTLLSRARYIAMATLTIFTNIAMVAIFSNLTSRTTLTMLVALFSVSVGFLWSRFVYKKPRITQPGY